MPLLYAGIDEAGYGPLLGPLCVGLSLLEVSEWNEGEAAPDLWKLLSAGVCRKPADPRRRIAVDDSKALKLANSSVARHPLVHLERGVAAFLACMDRDAREDDGEGLAGRVPASDAALFAALGAQRPLEEWYAGAPGAFPVGLSRGEAGIAASVLRATLDDAGVRVRALACEVMGEGVFNEVVEAGGSKAAATEAALAKHLWYLWDLHGAWGARAGNALRVVCDRQGGRTQYTELLRRIFPEARVRETHQTKAQSRYEIESGAGDGAARRLTMLFMTESESAHLPVALASMTAKLVRELFMQRFNRFWCDRMPELKPTAGYRNDAWRWLKDAEGVVAQAERHAMMRRA